MSFSEAVNKHLHASVLILSGLLIVLGVNLSADPVGSMRLVQGFTVLVSDEWWKVFNIFGHFLGAACLLLFMTRSHFMVWTVLAASAIGGAVSTTLKLIFDAPRPAHVMQEHLHIIGETLLQGSMPSGHAMTIGMVAGLSLALYPKLSAIGKRIAWVVCALMIFVCLARIASGAHWPADVCVGAGLGLALGAQIGRLMLARIHRLPRSEWFTEWFNQAARLLIAISLIVIPLAPSCSADASVALGLALAFWQLRGWHRIQRSWFPNPKSSKT